MDLNLDTLKQDILDSLEAGGFAVFYSSPGALEGIPMVMWDAEHHPDFQMFLEVARKCGQKLMLFASREFESSDVDELLEQLIQGTAMDLQPEAMNRRGVDGLDIFATFTDLYRYCYYVASVVGLVCIRIFGYSSPAAEKLAEETGIAFQLTNILRDVREDAERGRVYIPADELAASGTSAVTLAHVRNGAELTESQRRVLAGIARRARAYYHSADRLLPLINADSRPALRGLVKIYSRLLTKIEERHFDVFTSRVQLPTWEKLLILSGGVTRMFWLRLRGKAR